MPEFNDGQRETKLPTSSHVETDVLIVGPGPTGASAALFLSTLIRVRRRRLRRHPPRDNVTKLALMDLAPYTRWTLITGIAGEEWTGAAEKVARDLGIPLETVVIGPGREVTDLCYDWAKLREVEESGAILVRPDKHVAWRSMSLADDPEAALRGALAQLLGRV